MTSYFNTTNRNIISTFIAVFHILSLISSFSSSTITTESYKVFKAISILNCIAVHISQIHCRPTYTHTHMHTHKHSYIVIRFYCTLISILTLPLSSPHGRAFAFSFACIELSICSLLLLSLTFSVVVPACQWPLFELVKCIGTIFAHQYAQYSLNRSFVSSLDGGSIRAH